jgi:hypothetical protein
LAPAPVSSDSGQVALLKEGAMTYLDDVVEEIKAYKVVTYCDHFANKFARYFDTFDLAFDYYKSKIGDDNNADYVAGVALVNVQTGAVIHKESWRV